MHIAIPKLRTRSCIITAFQVRNVSNEPGVALVPKQALAEVIQRAGYTGNPVAIPITQEPANFGQWPTRAIESTQRSADFWSNSVSVNKIHQIMRRMPKNWSGDETIAPQNGPGNDRTFKFESPSTFIQMNSHHGSMGLFITCTYSCSSQNSHTKSTYGVISVHLFGPSEATLCLGHNAAQLEVRGSFARTTKRVQKYLGDSLVRRVI